MSKKKQNDIKKNVKGKPRKKNFDKEEFKEKFNKDKKDELVPKKSGWNRPSWYIPDENIRRTVGSFSFSNTLGIPIILNESSPLIPAYMQYDNWVPTIMEIQTFPYPGDDSIVNYYAIPAISTAGRKMYTAISAVNSKTTQYTPPTLSKAILVVGDLVSLISYAQRAIGVAFTYNPRNRQLPKQLLTAMGFNADNILDNLPLFRNMLNTVITMANNIRMPKDIAYFEKCWDMYADFYQDENSAMAQYYVMRPAGYLQLDESNTPSDIAFTPFPANMSYSTFINILKTVVQAILDSQTLNYVFTDVINYVLKQGGDLLGFGYVPELYSVLPKYDTVFLDQVHNMSWGYFDLSNYVISEDVVNNTLVTTNIFKWVTGTDNPTDVAVNLGDQILDLQFTDAPTPDDIIDALAFKTIIDDIDVGDNTGDPFKVYEKAIPDHPVYKVIIHATDAQQRVLSHCYPYITTDISTITMVTGFKVAPIIYWTATNPLARRNSMSVLNFFTVIGVRQLRPLFDWYMLGLFDAEVKGVTPF